MDNGWIDGFIMDTDTQWIRRWIEKTVGKICKFWLRPNLQIFPTDFLDPSPYPLCIRIHYESVYPSIIHHVSLSIILSRLRIHLEAPGRHCVDIGTILCRHCRHWRFSADIADILPILCRHCRHFGFLCVYCLLRN